VGGGGKKLLAGLRVLRAAPRVATRSCHDCQRFLYDEQTGEQVRRPARFGLPVRRPPGTLPPCHQCPKVPDDAPFRTREYAVDLTDQNWQALAFYSECRAVGQFPADPIVRRWAGLIRAVEDAHERGAVSGKLDAITTLLKLLVMKGASRG
jgi:hypothetical protein